MRISHGLHFIRINEISPTCPQMESGQSAWELMDRREIRENVTQALASLPVSSLLDVDQISSALSQSTVRNYFEMKIVSSSFIVNNDTAYCALTELKSASCAYTPSHHLTLAKNNIHKTAYWKTNYNQLVHPLAINSDYNTKSIKMPQNFTYLTSD